MVMVVMVVMVGGGDGGGGWWDESDGELEYPDEVILDNSAGEATDIRRGMDKGGTNTSPIKCERDTSSAMALCL